MDPMIFTGTILIAVIIVLGLFWKAKLSPIKGLVVGVSIGLVSGFFVYLASAYVIQGLDSSVILLLDFVAVLVVGLSLFTIYFFRDPERSLPEKEGVIVAPADGRIKYIKEIMAGQIPVSVKGERKAPLEEMTKTSLLDDDGYLIGIVMSIVDVHKNRAPIAGKVVLMKHNPGKFHSLKGFEGMSQNERNTFVIEGRDMKVGVIQIASRLVRRVVSYVKEGDSVEIGQRIGMIKFSSQTDLIIPRACMIKVKDGDQVYGGKTIIAEYKVK